MIKRIKTFLSDQFIALTGASSWLWHLGFQGTAPAKRPKRWTPRQIYEISTGEKPNTGWSELCTYLANWVPRCRSALSPLKEDIFHLRSSPTPLSVLGSDDFIFNLEFMTDLSHWYHIFVRVIILNFHPTQQPFWGQDFVGQILRSPGKIWWFPKIGVPPVFIHFNRVSHYTPSSYWGTPMTMENPHMIY